MSSFLAATGPLIAYNRRTKSNSACRIGWIFLDQCASFLFRISRTMLVDIKLNQLLAEHTILGMLFAQLLQQRFVLARFLPTAQIFSTVAVECLDRWQLLGCPCERICKAPLIITARHTFVGKDNQSICIAWLDRESLLRFTHRTAFIVELVEYGCLQSENSRILAVISVVII